MSLALACVFLFTQISTAPAITPAERQQLANLREFAETKWAKEISELEKLDREQPDPPNSILFVGSSSIRLWKSMAEDMSPWPTIRRGYGGAKFTDLVVFAERLVAKHDYRALVVFVANDITGGEGDRTPEEVLALYQLFVKLVRQSHPDKPIFFIAITPNSKRWSEWSRIERANLLIQQYTATDSKLHFIETAKHYLGDDGKPRDDLFTEDKLHQNSDGYKQWATIIKKALAEKLGSPTSSPAR